MTGKIGSCPAMRTTARSPLQSRVSLHNNRFFLSERVSDPVYTLSYYLAWKHFQAPGWQVSSCLCVCYVAFFFFLGSQSCWQTIDGVILVWPVSGVGPCRSLQVAFNFRQLHLGHRVSWRGTSVCARMSQENKSRLTPSNLRSSFSKQ